ncbi:T9SS type A sorting domain-containing protein [Pontibacter sp. SGAir0037]|uniref:T9SS type A sorting domain-containing protein n=1 Tax=Pontibacter sp. SGAir0037 TaxID=2571030 RepID=UPI0010CCE89A|nr:T9SS type A sorting domain-containing protein [Pontibacter sp. SGAir0037]QCR22842.1 hypothetical protein C1N53_11140 [Pontibacter sp. SGAir0037]
MEKMLNPRILVEWFLLLLLSLLLNFNATAQNKGTDKAGTDEKKVRIRMMQTIDGKTLIVDTLMAASDFEASFGKLKGLHADAAALRLQMREMRRLQNLDSLAFAGGRRQLFIYKNPVGDTALSRRLKMLVTDSLHTRFKNGNLLLNRFPVKGIDSLTWKRIQKIIIADSAAARLNNRLRLSLKGDTIIFKRTNPQILRKVPQDSGQIFLLPTFNSIADTLFIIKGRHYDSLAQKAVKSLKHIKTGDGYITSVTIVKTMVADLSKEEKSTLTSAGAPVETPATALGVEDFSFYPNPSDGRFEIAFKLKNEATVKIRILDITGKEVYSEALKGVGGEYRQAVNIAKLGSGMYFLQVIQNEKYLTKKLVIQ